MSQPHPKALQGIGLMLVAMLCFPFLDVLAKKLGQQGVPVIEIVWARMFLGTLLSMPLLWILEGKEALNPRQSVLNITRGIAILLTTFFFFSAMKFQGIAETLAIYFVQPILVTALAPFLLGEKASWQRWLAVLTGFTGVLVIIRPGLIAFNPGSALALCSGLAAAFVILISRKLAGGSSALANTFYTSMFGGIICSVLLLAYWQWPTGAQWAMMLGVAVLGSTCNFLIIKAFEWCEASLLAPFGYAEMINAVLAGWYFFGDFPDFWTFVGLAILVACALAVSTHERSRILAEDPGRQ
jgi:drug/metabolite transporter (DMT)-like permease